MRHDIPKKSVEEIVHRLVEGLQPEQIILFGSYAYGHPTEGIYHCQQAVEKGLKFF